MTLAQQDGLNDSTDLDTQEMLELGIVRVPVDYFHYRDFRYTNVADAIAEAKRDEARGTAAQRDNPM